MVQSLIFLVIAFVDQINLALNNLKSLIDKHCPLQNALISSYGSV